MKKSLWNHAIRSLLSKSSQVRRTRRSRRASLTESLESRVLLSAVAEFVNPHPVTNDQFGASMTVLTNGNVVVMAPNDDAGGGSAAQALGQGTGGAGAVYLYNGHTGALISTLTGSSPGDFYQAKVTALTNGNFVVDTLNWNGGLGAVTWGSGTSGVSAKNEFDRRPLFHGPVPSRGQWRHRERRSESRSESQGA
jgi:hypothetical protein